MGTTDAGSSLSPTSPETSSLAPLQPLLSANKRGIGLVFETGATVTAEGTVAAQILEFSPDLIAALKRRHQAAQARKSATINP